MITWEAKKEQIFEMPTGGAAIMRQGPNLLKLARKEQCLALLTQLRTKFKTDGYIYRVFPNGEVQYLHPKVSAAAGAGAAGRWCSWALAGWGRGGRLRHSGVWSARKLRASCAAVQTKEHGRIAAAEAAAAGRHAGGQHGAGIQMAAAAVARGASGLQPATLPHTAHPRPGHAARMPA